MSSDWFTIICPKCKVELVEGIFLEDGYAENRGRDSFTQLPIPPAKADEIEIKKCLKCPKCGHSESIDPNVFTFV